MEGKTAGYLFLHSIYDRWQASYGMEYSRRILPKLLATIGRYGNHPASAVDLGCGTGTLALLLADRQINVTGVDSSPGMVDTAKRKATAAGVNATFETADIRTFSLPRQVHLAVSVYDVLNHLASPEDLLLAFTATRRALLPGGLFVFDLNNDRCFRRLWTESEMIRHRDFSMLLENSYNRRLRIATSHVTVSFPDSREEIVETVQERCFLRREVRTALHEAGFTLLEVEDFAFPGMPGAGKLKTWWVARAGGSRTEPGDCLRNTK